jgi:phosphatidylserine decarboxylase
VSFAREGVSFIIVSALVAAGVFVVALNRRSWPLWLLGFVLTLIAIWVASFFRDPERLGDRGEQLVIAPADGKVIMVADVDEPTFLKAPAKRISIFMNIFNVHVNRYPITGTVNLVERKAGRFLNAAASEASMQNEQTSVGIASATRRILVRQIAGLIARRIVTYSHSGEHVVQGERMGLIRFGSRVDLFVPANAVLRVQPGDLTYAGVTVVAELP